MVDNGVKFNEFLSVVEEAERTIRARGVVKTSADPDMLEVRRFSSSV